MAINKTEPQTVAAKTASAVEGLSREETKHVKEALRPRAAVVYEIVRTEGEAELIRPFSALWWSGVAAGISIGFSFLSEAALAALLPASDWRPIIAKLGYAVGFDRDPRQAATVHGECVDCRASGNLAAQARLANQYVASMGDCPRRQRGRLFRVRAGAVGPPDGGRGRNARTRSNRSSSHAKCAF